MPAFLRNRLIKLTRACIDSTCANGSMPARGSSSISTSFTVKPGPVKRFRLTAPMCTGPVERCFERRLNAGAQPVRPQERRDEAGGQHHQQRRKKDAPKLPHSGRYRGASRLISSAYAA